MSEYVLGAGAEGDIDGIWEYIASDSVRAADRFSERLFDAFEAVARTPGMGHKREDLTSCSVLFWPVGEYLVIYSAEPLPVDIVAVVRGSRDIPVFLHQRGS